MNRRRCSSFSHCEKEEDASSTIACRCLGCAWMPTVKSQRLKRRPLCNNTSSLCFLGRDLSSVDITFSTSTLVISRRKVNFQVFRRQTQAFAHLMEKFVLV